MIRPLRGALEEAGPLRATRIIVILTHALGIFAYATLWRTFFAPDFDVNDFKAYYTGALALREGRPDLLYPDPATLNLGVLPDQPWVRFAIERGVPHPSGYIYPPFLAVVLRPLAALTYHRANQAWFALNLVFFAVSVALLIRLRPWRLDLPAAGGVLFASLCFYPTLRAFQCGQVSLLMLVLLAGSAWALARERDSLAGALVGVAAAVKLTPVVIVLFFLATRRWRAAAWAAAAGAACLALSIGGAGWESHLTFARGILPALSRGAVTFANQSLPGFVSRLASESSINVFEFVEEPASIRLLGTLSSAAVLAASLYLARRHSLRGDVLGGYALVIVASLIASPISWEHHFVLALIPIAVLLHDGAERGRLSLGTAFLLACSYALIAANAYDLIRQHFPSALARVAIAYALGGAVGLGALIAARAGSTGVLAPAEERQDRRPAGAGIAS